VQGRKSRYRSPDDVEALIRQNWEKGLFRFFITDDNFARNREWEAIFDRIIELRERDRIELQLIIQVDTSCHRIAGFVDKAQRAGVTRVFIGLENINPDNLLSAKKRQNKITEYRRMLLAWKNAGVVSYCGYIIGFPADSPESVLNEPDHPTRIAARILVFLPDATPGLGGSQGALAKGRRNGSRHEQVRSRAHRRKSSPDECPAVA
jgi:radical SAM superfamily enzyme YgiQ (UPF0313 family)